MELTNRQREVLSALVNGYQSSESPMTGAAIADVVDRHPGTIRNQMQTLKALDLVEGIPGPKGGYKPTTNAYRALDREEVDEAEQLRLARDYDRVDVTVDVIDFVNVHHPEKCRARLVFQQPVSEFDVGDPIVVGPTPTSDLVVVGEVLAVDPSANELQVDVVRLEAPFEESADVDADADA